MTASDEAKKIFEAYQRELLERQRANSSSFDKAVLTLSTAGLGVSISFSETVIANWDAVQCLILLKLSWGCFAAAIVSTILSFMASQNAISKRLTFAEKYYLENKDEYLNKKTLMETATGALNNFSGMIFIVAVALTVIFVMTNT